MSFINNMKMRSSEVIALLLSFAEMLAGIFSETLSFTALGIFTALLSFGFFEREIKNGRKIAAAVVAIIFFAYIAVISVFEMTQTVGYFKTSPQFWIFPVIAFLFICRIGFEKNFKDGENGGAFISGIGIAFYAVTLICTILGVFVEYYVEPVWAVGLSVGGIYMLLKNFNWGKK